MSLGEYIFQCLRESWNLNLDITILRFNLRYPLCSRIRINTYGLLGKAGKFARITNVYKTFDSMCLWSKVIFLQSKSSTATVRFPILLLRKHC